MKLSRKITRILAAVAVAGMIAAPALASTTIPGSLLAGKGYGDTDGTSAGDYGPGTCDEGVSAVDFTTDDNFLLVKNGSGNGKGAGDRDRTRDQKKDGSCQTS